MPGMEQEDRIVQRLRVKASQEYNDAIGHSRSDVIWASTCFSVIIVIVVMPRSISPGTARPGSNDGEQHEWYVRACLAQLHIIWTGVPSPA